VFPNPYFPPRPIATAQEHQRDEITGCAPLGADAPQPLDQPDAAVLECPEFDDGEGLWSPDFSPEAGQ
jgi:hypothetical protein